MHQTEIELLNPYKTVKSSKKWFDIFSVKPTNKKP